MLKCCLETKKADLYIKMQKKRGIRNPQHSLLSRFCYQVNDEVIKEFFRNNALAKAYDAVEDDILSQLEEVFNKPGELSLIKEVREEI
jgi:hypothetical protein